MQTGLHTRYMCVLALLLHFACAPIDDSHLPISWTGCLGEAGQARQ